MSARACPSLQFYRVLLPVVGSVLPKEGQRKGLVLGDCFSTCTAAPGAAWYRIPSVGRSKHLLVPTAFSWRDLRRCDSGTLGGKEPQLCPQGCSSLSAAPDHPSGHNFATDLQHLVASSFKGAAGAGPAQLLPLQQLQVELLLHLIQEHFAFLQRFLLHQQLPGLKVWSWCSVLQPETEVLPLG